MENAREHPAGNRFLRALPPEVSQRLAPQLEPITLRHGMVLAAPGDPLDYLHFPDRGLVSLVKMMHDGRTAEVGAIGVEGMTGVAALAGIEETVFQMVVQVDGSGRRLKSSALRWEVEQSPVLKTLVMRYLYYAINRLAQTAACNRLHTLKERCCRWLLAAHDGAQASTFILTHEFLALMMGVNRPALSLAMGSLRRRGTVRYTHGRLTVLDRHALEEGACECYAEMRREEERVYSPSCR